MGRFRKKPVRLNIAVSNEVSPPSISGLPEMRSFIDISNGRTGANLYFTRLYFKTPDKAELRDGQEKVSSSIGRDNAISTYCEMKISKEFGEGLSRLIINFLDGKYKARSTIEHIHTHLIHFVDYVARKYARKLPVISIFSFDIKDWVEFRSFVENLESADKKSRFNYPKSIFQSYAPTSCDGSLVSISAPNNKVTNTTDEPLQLLLNDSTYSNSVMYQLLGQFLYHFNRQIGYLKYYENLKIDDFGSDFIPPLSINSNENKVVKRSKYHELILKWLSNEADFQKILDHKLLWYKLGRSIDRGFVRMLQYTAANDKNANNKYVLYNVWERKSHDLGVSKSRNNIFGLYVKRHPSIDKTGNMNQLCFCLANLVMIYTGLNKEVVLSWPSRVNGKSLLDVRDNLFIGSNDNSNEVLLTGTKARTGALTKDKKVSVSIVVESPLFMMLREYELHAKTNFDGPFFEVGSKVLDTHWGGKKDLFKNYSVIDDSGNKILCLDTRKFRKVFASTRMLELMKGIKSPQDLADRLRKDLDHNNLDVTLSNYIFQSSLATNVLDIAIATITQEKIQSAIQFQGSIGGKSKPINRISVYLCDCSDPTKPTHGYAISDKCSFYDLCLGCKRSIIFEMHLPFICYRILQYEERRNEMGNLWSAVFEDKWMIAHDALDKYKIKDKENGERLVAEAWIKAKSGQVLLPPIIMTRI